MFYTKKQKFKFLNKNNYKNESGDRVMAELGVLNTIRLAELDRVSHDVFALDINALVLITTKEERDEIFGQNVNLASMQVEWATFAKDGPRTQLREWVEQKRGELAAGVDDEADLDATGEGFGVSAELMDAPDLEEDLDVTAIYSRIESELADSYAQRTVLQRDLEAADPDSEDAAEIRSDIDGVNADIDAIKEAMTDLGVTAGIDEKEARVRSDLTSELLESHADRAALQRDLDDAEPDSDVAIAITSQLEKVDGDIEAAKGDIAFLLESTGLSHEQALAGSDTESDLAGLNIERADLERELSQYEDGSPQAESAQANLDEVNQRITDIAAAAPDDAEPLAAVAPDDAEPLAAAAPDDAEPLAAVAPDDAEPLAAVAPDDAEPLAAVAPGQPSFETLSMSTTDDLHLDSAVQGEDDDAPPLAPVDDEAVAVDPEAVVDGPEAVAVTSGRPSFETLSMSTTDDLHLDSAVQNEEARDDLAAAAAGDPLAAAAAGDPLAAAAGDPLAAAAGDPLAAAAAGDPLAAAAAGDPLAAAAAGDPLAAAAGDSLAAAAEDPLAAAVKAAPDVPQRADLITEELQAFAQNPFSDITELEAYLDEDQIAAVYGEGVSLDSLKDDWPDLGGEARQKLNQWIEAFTPNAAAAAPDEPEPAAAEQAPIEQRVREFASIAQDSERRADAVAMLEADEELCNKVRDGLNGVDTDTPNDDVVAKFAEQVKMDPAERQARQQGADVSGNVNHQTAGFDFKKFVDDLRQAGHEVDHPDANVPKATANLRSKPDAKVGFEYNQGTKKLVGSYQTSGGQKPQTDAAKAGMFMAGMRTALQQSPGKKIVLTVDDPAALVKVLSAAGDLNISVNDIRINDGGVNKPVATYEQEHREEIREAVAAERQAVVEDRGVHREDAAAAEHEDEELEAGERDEHDTEARAGQEEIENENADAAQGKPRPEAEGARKPLGPRNK